LISVGDLNRLSGLAALRIGIAHGVAAQAAQASEASCCLLRDEIRVVAHLDHSRVGCACAKYNGDECDDDGAFHCVSPDSFQERLTLELSGGEAVRLERAVRQQNLAP